MNKITKIYKIYKNNFDRLKEIFIKKNFHKEFIANDDISFELLEGETLGILGVNGAGKSTILKIIAGVVSPTYGEIVKYGRITALLELGTGFNAELSGYDNIYLNGTLIGMSNPEIDFKIQEIVNFSELGDFIYEPIKTYSSGMKMRLAFSIAIFSEPKILIVDEALSVGDAHFQAKCTNALTERKKKNMSIIYVSHDLNSLKVLCDRAILLENGKVLSSGKPEEVINSYNFLIAKLNDHNDTLQIDEQKGNSFGTFDIEIKDISLKKDGEIIHDISSGDLVDIEINLFSKIDIDDVTIGIHIRDKYGQDIYGTNTFFQKKIIKLQANKHYICKYSMSFNIGTGQYTLGSAVHTGDWHTKECFHWMDNALEFNILCDKDNSFIGLCKLNPTINYKEITT